MVPLCSLCPARPRSQAVPSARVQPCRGPREPLACRSLGSWGPCKQPPATRTETRPVLRTLLHCKGCGDPRLPAAGTQGSPHAPVWPAEPQPGHGCLCRGGCRGCRCWLLGAVSVRLRLGRARRLPGSALTREAAAGSLRAITVCQRGAARGHGQDAGCQGGHSGAQVPPAIPCGRESLAVTSGDKAPYGDGEGRRLATARGRFREGAGGGSSCAHPGGFACSAAPTYQGLHSAAAQVGCPSGRWQRGPCGPHAAGGASGSLRPWPRTRKHHVLGPGSWGRGQGGSSHFTLFREYEFTRKSRDWALSWPPGPPGVETGSRSCTKWERGGGRGREQPAQGVTGRAFGWEAAGQESWGCRNLLKTLRLFFP